MIPQDAVPDYARSDEIYDENLVQFRLDICGGIKRPCGLIETARLLLFHAKDMVHIILSGICKMVDINRIHLDFVDAGILVNEQSAEIVFAHQRIIFQYAHLRESRKLLCGMKDFICKLSCVRHTDFGFVEFQESQKFIPRLI